MVTRFRVGAVMTTSIHLRIKLCFLCSQNIKENGEKSRRENREDFLCMIPRKP